MIVKFGKYTFSDANHDILSADSYRDQALIAESLQADEFNFTAKVSIDSAGFNIDDFEKFKYGEKVTIMEDDETTVLSVFYAVDVNVSAYLQSREIVFTFKCLSFVGIFVDVENDGGIWSNTTNEAVIAYICDATYRETMDDGSKHYICSNGLEYYIDKNVASKRVDGWLPIASARDNLCKVLNASCVSILKRNDGAVRFTFNQPAIITEIDPDYEYIGDHYSNTERYTDVAIVEHSFYASPSQDSEQIYDSEGQYLSSAKLVFDEPYFDLSWSGGAIEKSNCNYAVVSGSGVLTGKKYVHGQTKLSAKTGLVGSAKYYTSDTNTLITALNGAAALERLANYFGKAKELSCAFVVKDNVTTGTLVKLFDPLNRENTGFIKRMNILHSGIDKSDTTVVTNWIPVAIDEEFEECAVLTDSGTFNVPAGVNRIMVVCIQGGTGGSNGENGSNGSGTNGGAGGSGGTGGRGGKINQIVIKNPSSVYTYSAGVGGTNGNDGGESVFSENGNIVLSSADGARAGAGYMNIITGDVYATDGVSGVGGAKGGNGGKSICNVSSATYDLSAFIGERGGSVGDYTGGKYGALNTANVYKTWRNTSGSWRGYDSWLFSGASGGGGGAAYGADGKQGGAGSATVYGRYNNQPYGINSMYGGSGGAGGDASPPSRSVPIGGGGDGGNGGGGGGGRGYSAAVTVQTPGEPSSTTPGSKTSSYNWGSAGRGGYGSNGSAGGHGAILIYY